MSPVNTQDSSQRPQIDSTNFFKNIIFDIGDVLFTWFPTEKLAVSPQKLKAILCSSMWFEHEKGKISQQECYSLAAAAFDLDYHDISIAFQIARESLRPEERMFGILRALKASGLYRIYAMSNISAPDYEVLRTRCDPDTWDLFDEVFTSAAAGERKPNLGYFHHVISKTGINPQHTIFIDDKVENVLTARSLGMHGILFDGSEKIFQQLLSLCDDDPIGRALEYLNNNRKNLNTITSTHQVVHENFSQLLILEAIGDSELVDVTSSSVRINFFKGKGQLTSQELPDDVDTTAIAFTVLPDIDHQTKMKVMNEIVGLCNRDGIVQVYFDPSRPRIDPIVCINALTLFYANGQGHDLDSTLEWCYSVLVHRAYIDGTMYYVKPEAFLFFLSRLIMTSDHVRSKFETKFRERLSERIGVEGDALALAMRILAGAVVGIRDTVDYLKLRSMQESDGSWPIGWFYKYRRSGELLGNKGLTTALALNAVKSLDSLCRKSSMRPPHPKEL